MKHKGNQQGNENCSVASTTFYEVSTEERKEVQVGISQLRVTDLEQIKPFL